MPPKRGSRRGRGRGAKTKGAAATETPEPETSQEALDVSTAPSEGADEETMESGSQETADSALTGIQDPPTSGEDMPTAAENGQQVIPEQQSNNLQQQEEQQPEPVSNNNEQQADSQESVQPIVIEEKEEAMEINQHQAPSETANDTVSETNIAEPKAAEPVAQSTEPVAQSTEPVAQPTEPVAQSTEPVAQSAEPVAQSAVTEQKSPDANDSDNQSKLVSNGVNAAVATEICNVINNGLLSYDDINAEGMEFLKNYPAEHIASAVKEFSETDFAKISDKGAHLLSILKAWEENKSGASGSTGGPNEAKIKEMLERTGYKHEVTGGQRLYGPPANWEGDEPTHQNEVFIGKIPPDVFEDDLVPLCEQCGKLYDIRIKIDPQTGNNRGFAFVRFAEKEAAKLALEKLNDYEIRPRKQIKVNVSTPNMRLYVGNIPKNKSKQEIMDEISKITENLKEVIVYASVNEDNPVHTNRGFCFLQFNSHTDAANARRVLLHPETRVFGTNVRVNWADAVDEDVNMEEVKNLYIRNLSTDVTEEILKEKFGAHGPLEKVKRVRDFGFVHFENREDALNAMKELHGTTLGKYPIEVTLARPVSDRTKQKREMRKIDSQRWGPSRGGFGLGINAMGRGGWADYGRSQGYGWAAGAQGWPQRQSVGNFYRGRGGPVGLPVAAVPSYQPYAQHFYADQRGFAARPGFGRGFIGGFGHRGGSKRGGGGSRGGTKRKAQDQPNQANGSSEAKRDRQDEAPADSGANAAANADTGAGQQQASADQDWTSDVAGTW